MTRSKPGPKSLAERYGEETVSVKVIITKSQHEYIMGRANSASSFIRYLIEISMLVRGEELKGVNLESYNVKELLEHMEDFRKAMDMVVAEEDED